MPRLLRWSTRLAPHDIGADGGADLDPERVRVWSVAVREPLEICHTNVSAYVVAGACVGVECAFV